MITAEIKLYDEPKPVEITKYSLHNSQLGWTDNEVEKAIAEAMSKVKIGDKYKYKSNSGIITVTGYTSDRHGMYNGSYGLNVIEGKRSATQYMSEATQRYGVNEFFSTWMEKVEDETTENLVQTC